MTDHHWRLVRLSANLTGRQATGEPAAPGFRLELLCTSEIGRSILTATREAAETALAPLRELETELRGSDAAMKLGRLQAAMERAQRGLANARHVEEAALRQARLLIGDGSDPSPAEEEASEAGRQQAVLTNRIEGLTSAIAAAAQAVGEERRQAVAARKVELRSAALEHYQAAERDLLTMLHIHLPRLLSADGAVQALRFDADDLGDDLAAERDREVRAQIEAVAAAGRW